MNKKPEVESDRVEKAGSAPTPKEKETKRLSPQEVQKKVDTSVNKWKKTADKPGHTKEYKKGVEDMFAPIQTEWEKMLKTMPDTDITQYVSALEDLQGKAGQTAKLKPATTKKPMRADKPATSTKSVATSKGPSRPLPKPQGTAKVRSERAGRSTEVEKERQRRKGVLERTKELGGKRLDDTLTLNDTKFTSLNGNGGVDDKDWGKDEEYIRTADFLNKTIYLGIETAPPHNFTVYTDWQNKIHCANKEAVQFTINTIKANITYKDTREPLTFAQQKMARDRMEGTNEVIKRLGGKSMDRPLYLAGLKFTFDTSEEEEGNWVNGKGGIVARATYKGKEIYFNIARSAPHVVTVYDKSGLPSKSFTNPKKAVLEKYIAARKKEINA